MYRQFLEHEQRLGNYSDHYKFYLPLDFFVIICYIIAMDKYPIDECPVCLEPMDYCQGHGEIGDPEGFRVLENYYDEDNG